MPDVLHAKGGEMSGERRDDLVAELSMLDTCANSMFCGHKLCGLILRARGVLGKPSEHEALREELRQRRACLVGARDTLTDIIGAGVEDGGLWIRSVAEARIPFLDEAIKNTDNALSVGWVWCPICGEHESEGCECHLEAGPDTPAGSQEDQT